MISRTSPAMAARKPRLVFFQFAYDERLPRFLLLHKEEHVRCLQQTFEVIVISHDCDYDTVCSTHEPDLALFESGVPTPLCRRLDIVNTHTHDHIPKIGLLHADAFCQGRAGFISDMYEFGIETFFAIATAAIDYNRELQGRLFLWPNSIDPAIYRDYGQTKCVEVLFTGNTSSLYPWRQRLLEIVPKRYSSTIEAHPGYVPSAQAARVLVGEAYARLINTAWFVPSCGTVAHEIVRKHFEIPGCNACLITERSAAIEAAGYVDMLNCVFADEHNVLDKLEVLFRDPDRLREITRSGHALVHARHTMAQRDQIRQWFDLNRTLPAGQAIEQAGPFSPLCRVDRERVRFPEPSARPQLDLIEEGDDKFDQQDYPAAIWLYQRAALFIDYMPEPHVRIARCELQRGHAAEALSRVTRPLEFSLGSYGARDPDPIEWSLYILCLLCLGRRAEAAGKADAFAHVDHLALRRVRWLVALCSGNPAGVPIPLAVYDTDRPTIHRLRPLPSEAWAASTGAALAANGRHEWAAMLSRAVQMNHTGRLGPAWPPAAPTRPHGNDSSARETHAGIRRQFARRRRWRLVKRLAIDKARSWLHALESRHGYFLPYRLSAIRHAECMTLMRTAFEDAAVESAIAIAPDARDPYVRGFHRIASANAGTSVIHSLNSWNTHQDAQRQYDLALVDCATTTRHEQLLGAIAHLCHGSRYLFLINCGAMDACRIDAVVGSRLARIGTRLARSGCQHIAFKRICAHGDLALSTALQRDVITPSANEASAQPGAVSGCTSADPQVAGFSHAQVVTKP